MGYDDPDPYHQPEKFGLTLVGEIEWAETYYSFDLTVVWVGEDGTVYWADDTGCSCPSPYEDLRDVGDLNNGTKWDALAHLQSRGEGNRHVNAGEYADLCAKVAAL